MVKSAHPSKTRKFRGFQQAGGLLKQQIRRAGESRGFAETRLLTDWVEIVGQDIAAISRPVKISYTRNGFGATLILLTTGANAPILQAESPKIKERVNKMYGYNAISHIKVTQTAPTGFAEGQVDFAPKRKATEPEPLLTVDPKAKKAAAEIRNADLSAALERLAQNVFTKTKSK